MFLTRSRGAPGLGALCGHKPERGVLARTKSGTLSLREDAQGVVAEFVPPDTTLGRDMVEEIRRGDLSGASFQFVYKKDRWTEGRDGLPLRQVFDADLLEVSLVAFPAYPTTTAEVVTREQQQREEDDFRAQISLLLDTEENAN